MSERNGFDLDTDLMPIIEGKVMLPNFEEMALEDGVAVIACAGGIKTIDGVRNAKVPESKSSWGHWARYWLNLTQGGAYDGTGYVMFYDAGKGRVAKFAACKHDYVNTGSRDREHRGYHSGHCSKCGLDMSVDSSGLFETLARNVAKLDAIATDIETLIHEGTND